MAARIQVGREPTELTEELASVPKLLAGILAGHDDTRLTWRPDDKTWSASDLLAHLRSCAEVQGKWIAAMLDRDNPTFRAVSPRSAFRKYVDRDVALSLKEFTEERAALVKRLRSLDPAGWKRTLTFTGASPRSTIATVTACAWGLVQHEKDHLDQFRNLLS
ncbi:MAG: DinB family protein [Tepidiformaceae bacterium]